MPIPALILLVVLLLGGCAAGPAPELQTVQIQSARIPFRIKDNAIIGLVPVLYPEPDLKKDFYDYFLPPPGKDKYEQSKRYATLIANLIKEEVSQLGFTPFIASPARTEDLYAPEFFEVLKISCPAEYCVLIYLYELSDTEKKISRIEPDKSGDTPVEQWQQDAIARTRIELYESANMNLVWQYDVNAKALMITEKKISGSKPLDDLAYSLIQPHYSEQINNEIIQSTIREMIRAFKSLTVKVNPSHKVKTDIRLYDAKISNDRLLKDVAVSITGIALITDNENRPATPWSGQQFTTDGNGQVSLELPEGFYRIEAAPLSGDTKTQKIQTLIIGDVRRINIILK
jgi:hypothetical protein